MNNDALASFWDHFADLQRALIVSLAIILCAVVASFWFYQDILSIVAAPLQHEAYTRQRIHRERITNLTDQNLVYNLPQHAKVVNLSQDAINRTHNTIILSPQNYVDIELARPAQELAILSPIEGLTTSFKVCFWTGLVLSSPLWLITLLNFILPALHSQERQALAPFVFLSLLFLCAGGCFAYFITIPMANTYLAAFNQNIGINFWTLANYLDYTLFLLLANGIAFELGLVLFFLVHYNIVSSTALRTKRRHMIVVALILGALLTPPDVLTQLMLAIPLIMLYELAILYAAYKNSKAASSA